jgi:RNA polymerase sigma-70 factor (ECF subfamily)
VNNLGGAAEAVVVALASTGDAEAFDELVRRKQSSVRSLMRRISNDRTLAEDLAQQVFVEVWKSLPKLESPVAFPAWLKRIAVNVWLQHFRKKDRLMFDNEATDSAPDSPTDWTHGSREDGQHHHDPHGEHAQGHSTYHSHDHRIDLAAALGLLPTQVRLCVVLAYQEGMSHGEIAQSTGIALGTVKSHILRGSARLRELLKDYGASS